MVMVVKWSSNSRSCEIKLLNLGEVETCDGSRDDFPNVKTVTLNYKNVQILEQKQFNL